MKTCLRGNVLLCFGILLSSVAAIFGPSEAPSGPIEDALCNIEDLEDANDSQLFAILQALKTTDYFRNFVVDLEHSCPLHQDDFECGGSGEEEEDGRGLGGDDGPAEPLCTVKPGDESESSNPFESNALKNLQTTGFASQAQLDTFAWTTATDTVYTELTDKKQSLNLDWNDMCSSIGLGDSTSVVNLALNPERNTYYNGTHIWNAIYEENCLASPDLCLEERVLYKLLSGLHTSTTTSIAMNYYAPSKKKNRTSYAPNPEYFMEKVGEHPEYISNLHFSYAVMLRALRKASPFLETYPMKDQQASKLLKRLLETSILSSCSSVFDAFDESKLFVEDPHHSLQQNFKGVFHNVSSILDCVQCQQCKLHGKLAMTGYGAALKVLFMDKIYLEQNEIVGLINTVAKLSESIRHARELLDMYWKEQNDRSPTPLFPNSASSSVSELDLVDAAVGAIALLGRSGRMTDSRELALVKRAVERDPELLILAKHYGSNIERLADFIASVFSADQAPDAIVIGSGLAGLAATLNVLDRGGRVVLVEKEHLLGGNSAKASSGINACCPDNATDTIELFRNDTMKSAGSSANSALIDTLVQKSASAVEWLKTRVGVDLSLKAQLGGHSSKRTHRPSNGMAGAEIIYGMQKAVKSYVKSGQVEIMLDTKVTRLLMDENETVTGVEYIGKNGESGKLHATNVVLSTGGFASDRSPGSYLEQYRPELLEMPTTAGLFSTGDGISLATTLGATTTDMDKVQVHPTGWVDPSDPNNPSKILAAELMRGVGGILLNDAGNRFCNELGTRAYVTNKMFEHNSKFAKTGNWSVDARVPTFSLVLSSSAADDGKKHVDLYSHKGLLTKLEGVTALSEWLGLPKSVVASTLKRYQKAAAQGKDEFGKTTFRGLPLGDLDKEVFYAGKVTPVLHYCMGGIKIDNEGHVLGSTGKPIPGLFAAGEVSGGVHGVNRLAGNSLLECTVYGTVVGQNLPIRNPANRPDTASRSTTISLLDSKQKTEIRDVTLKELSQHKTEEDCWVAIHGIVYDLTSFADEHPAGAQSIHELAGKDGSDAFAAVHNQGMLSEFEEDVVGIFKP